MITLRTHGEASALALFDLFHGHGVTWTVQRGGWNTLTLSNWAGTDYAALVHARQAFPYARIYCPTARSARP